jgi:hypothetical protein
MDTDAFVGPCMTPISAALDSKFAFLSGTAKPEENEGRGH